MAKLTFWKWVEKSLDWLGRGDILIRCLASLGFGKFGAILLGLYAHLNPIWQTPVWILLTTAFLAIFVYWVPKWLHKTNIQRQHQTAIQGGDGLMSTDLDATQFFQHAYVSNVTAVFEGNIRRAAQQNSPNDREGFYARFIGVGIASYLYDILWAYIYKSQLLLLLEINRNNGYLPIAAAHAFYDKGAQELPSIYSQYSFDQWLGFLEVQQVIIHHASDMLEITIKGKDFLKYLTHCGRGPESRRG